MERTIRGKDDRGEKTAENGRGLRRETLRMWT
jgi:hypothetical protein